MIRELTNLQSGQHVEDKVKTSHQQPRGITQHPGWDRKLRNHPVRPRPQACPYASHKSLHLIVCEAVQQKVRHHEVHPALRDLTPYIPLDGPKPLGVDTAAPFQKAQHLAAQVDRRDAYLLIF